MNYFAAKPAQETASVLLSRSEMWFKHLYSNGYYDKIRASWMAYHGAYYGEGHSITFGGEQGEFSQMAVNHYRNIADLMCTMITNVRLNFRARASNSDSKSIIQTDLANGLLDYYVRQKRVEKYIHDAVKQAVVLATGYVKMEWNATSGDIYDYHPETGAPIYEGDIEFSNLEPFDVMFDPNKSSSHSHEWVLCRSFKNKYDLAAKYPEYKEKIEKLATKTDFLDYRSMGDMLSKHESDEVPVYEFFHKKTEAMPEGRYLLFLSTDIILIDMPMPYRRLPVYRISPSDILGTAFGYTPMFDLLPLQDALNALYSTVLTNQHTFGVQNIYVPRGADIQLKALEGGLNIIEGNSGQGKPEPINFTQTPAEVFSFIQMIEKKMETISGMNSVVRGDPEASIKSGSAMALVQSMALQFISGLQTQYVFMVEDIGMGIIELLRDFADVPRIALIAGESNVSYVRTEFTGDDLASIDRVIVDIGNPIAVTTAGKMQMASELLQYGIIKTPEDYFTVLNTGQFSSFIEDSQRQNNFVKRENEKMLRGEYVPVLATDSHMYHIRKHKAILDDPDMRDPNSPAVQQVLNHILEHIEMLRTTDPGLLSIMQEQPLGPANGTPPNPENMMMNPNMSAAPEGGAVDPNVMQPGQPQMPNMPELPEGAMQVNSPIPQG
jgi:hypothetical protein